MMEGVVEVCCGLGEVVRGGGGHEVECALDLGRETRRRASARSAHFVRGDAR